VLVIAELLTGTFYLLVLGIAAFGAAGAAGLGQGFAVQAIIACAVAAAGCYGVHVWRARNRAQMLARSRLPSTIRTRTSVACCCRNTPLHYRANPPRSIARRVARTGA
jgi:hypothetical protein